MRRDPFLDFHRTAETAGYPALLVVSLSALGLVVTPVLMLAPDTSVWTLVLALLASSQCWRSSSGLGAAFVDADEP